MPNAKGFITLHILNDIPWSNLNRDDTGTPKRTILGGVERGLLSSQSIKRAARMDFEQRVLKLYPEDLISSFDEKFPDLPKDGSQRSRYQVEWAIRRAKEILEARNDGSTLDEKSANKLGTGIITKLVGGDKTLVWLSTEELETFAQILADENGLPVEKAVDKIFLPGNRTGSLAIAAFGRMFASAQDKQTDAAIAVSPAISTHGNIIETDYFITADDFGWFKKDEKNGTVSENYEGAGAGHLGIKLFTSGIFYRTITIDVKELRHNWTGIDSANAPELLLQFVRSLIHGLPTGNKNHTAPYTVIPLVIAEQQSYREALSIAKPIIADPLGGFLDPSVEEIKRQFDNARRFNGSNYGETVIAGAAGGDESPTLEEVSQEVVNWIINFEKE